MFNQITIQSTPMQDEVVNTVNARDLHHCLGSKQDFSTWIKKRIAEYGFVENQDYLKIVDAPQKNGAEKSKTYANWQGRVDYHISLDMAKELAMVEKTAKGRAVRRYFIECEKRAYSQDLNMIAQLERLSLQLDNLTDNLSHAGRMLSIGGRQLKPKLLSQVEILRQKLQPSLELE